MDHGAELDAPTMSGGTPLTRAIESSRENVVDFLIQKGAKVQTENKKGISALVFRPIALKLHVFMSYKPFLVCQ